MAAENWKEYFHERFAGHEGLRVTDEGNSTRITSATGESRTTIEIVYGGGDWDLHDILFWNPESPASRKSFGRDSAGGGFFGSEREFTRENVDENEEWLDVPLCEGWTEEAIFVEGKHVKSILCYVQAGETVEITEYMEEVGCLLSIWQSLRYSERWNQGRMESRHITIRPMLRPT